MIVCFEGLQGEGKTASAILLARLFSEAIQKPIFSNATIQGAGKLVSLKQFYSLTNSIIIFDELHVNVDSRKFSQNMDFSYIITQQRKRQNLLFYTTQMIEMVDNRVRENTKYLIRCNQYNNQQKWTIYNYLDLYYKRPTTPLIKSFSLQLLERFSYPFYDTLEIIRPLSNL